MSWRRYSILLSLVLLCSVGFARANTDHPFVASNNDIGKHFRHVKEQVDVRWNAFRAQKEFTAFQTGRSDEDVKAEFVHMLDLRKSIWKEPEYTRAKHLIKANRVRHDGCVAFAYNSTHAHFNASTIFLGDKAYIACEGPRKKDLAHFFTLLSTLKATHIVRLTDAAEGDKRKCHAYWKKYANKTHLKVPAEKGVHHVRAFSMADWKDNQGINPERLLEVVLQVRKELQETDDGLLVVHCSAGVGRTGTFLAALAIVNAIDKNTAFSIQEIVYRLSLQRIYSVSTPSQYITLYRLAECYQKK